MTTQEVEREARRTVELLEKIREDRGKMAALRSLWIPARETKAWPLLSRFGSLENKTLRTVVALYALHPAHSENPRDASVGAVCAKLSNRHSTFDLRFRRLLACDWRELPVHLRPVAKAAAVNDIPIDYAQLYLDLRFWQDRVRLQWATDYYRFYKPDGEQGE